MNIQHSSKTDRWFTPDSLMFYVRQVLGNIELDPASEEAANLIVKADKFISEDSLNKEWKAKTVFLNPPGGKIGNHSQAALFWQKLVDAHQKGHVQEAIFIGFSLELLAVSQNYRWPYMLDYTICIPRRRIKFVNPLSPNKSAPSHSNVIVYLGENEGKFKKVFNSLGACK